MAVVSTETGLTHREPGLVGHQLEEQGHGRRPAVDPEDRGRRSGGRHGVEHVAELEAHGLDHGPGQVGPTGAPAEPDDGSPGPGVPVGAAEPGEGGDHHHPLAAVDGPGQRLHVAGVAR